MSQPRWCAMNPSRRADLRTDRRGLAAVEFALIAPVLLLVALALADLVVLMRAAWRMERAAGEVANVIAQLDALREADFAVLYDVANRIASPYALDRQGAAIMITGLSGQANGASVSWRRRTGDATFPSRFGTTGTAVLPVGFTLPAGQTAVAVETYVRVRPWLLGEALLGSGTTVMAGFGLFRPRLSTLAAISP